MDSTREQMPPRPNAAPLDGEARPKGNPERGVKQDVINPEQAEQGQPQKPMPDMNPEGQDPDEDETID